MKLVEGWQSGSSGRVPAINYEALSSNPQYHQKEKKIVLRRLGVGKDEKERQVNLIKIYCKHVCKCHTVSSMYNYYMLIKIKN
jgi:hypothetical protein